MVLKRVRIRFRKQGDLRWIGHQDLLRTWERVFRRAGIELAMSQGFHARPKIQLPLALALGVSGADEVLDVQLACPWNVGALRAAIEPQLPGGLRLNGVELLPTVAAPRVCSVVYELPVPEDRYGPLVARLEGLRSQPALPVDRGPDRPPLDLLSLVEELRVVEMPAESGTSLGGFRLRIRLRVSPQGGVRPRDMLAALGLDDLEQQACYLTRTAVELSA